MIKVICVGDFEVVKKVIEVGIVLDVKRIGYIVKDLQGWYKEKEMVMEEIVSVKVE